MVDSRGAVDLAVHAPELDCDAPSARERRELVRVADRTFGAGDFGPDSWVTEQLRFLAVAAVLESYVLHVRRQRLLDLRLSGDPEHLTLAQLAATHRPHHGVAGQAFEIAIAEGCNQQLPDVVGPISEALRLLGVRDPKQPRMLVLGLEKIASAPSDVWDLMRSSLPDGALLRTGRPGRPASPDTVLRRLSSATWQTMRPPTDLYSSFARRNSVFETVDGPFENDPDASQLGRCDALVYTETALVPASLKVNQRHIPREGWRDVPLWITTGQEYGAAQYMGRYSSRYPRTVATIGTSSYYMRAVYEAIAVVDLALLRTDREARGDAEARRIYGPMVKQLYTRRQESIAQITTALRKAAHPAIRNVFEPKLSVPTRDRTIPTLDAQPILEEWREQVEDGRLILGHQHLFIGSGPVDLSGERLVRPQREPLRRY